MAESETKKRTAYIAGITGSIGSDLAQRLIDAGWTVAGIARQEQKISSLSESLDIPCARADATSAEEVQSAFDELAEKVGPPDAYVHAVGSIILKPVHQTKDNEWHQTIDLNLNSAFYALRCAVKAMKNGGSIVLISSTAAQVGLPSHEAIAAAKGGLEALARSAAATYASRSIRINSVALGLVESNLSQPIVGSETGAIAYLLSDEASWVTGQSWAIDGGISRLRQKPKI